MTYTIDNIIGVEFKTTDGCCYKVGGWGTGSKKGKETIVLVRTDTRNKEIIADNNYPLSIILERVAEGTWPVIDPLTYEIY